MLDAIDAKPGTIVERRMIVSQDMVSPVSEDTLRYFEKPAETGDTILLTSRGCPFRCGFCYIQNFFERSWETVDMDRWKKDILFLRDRLGMKKLEHGDDWPGKMPRILEIVKFLWDNGIQYRPSIRAHQIDDEAAKMMADMGIRHVSIGMETGSERMLEITEKDIKKEHQVICAEALAKHNIWPLYYWIGPLVIMRWTYWLQGLGEHGGLTHEPYTLLNTRTLTTNAFMRWINWGRIMCSRRAFWRPAVSSMVRCRAI